MPGPSAALFRPASFAIAILLTGLSLLGYRVAKDAVTAEIYRDRLAALQERHAALTERYNAAVTRAAVTELVVDADAVSVVIRGADGVLERIATPYSAKDEVFIDYAVLDGKLWIRRVFDEHTPPRRGTLIDPALAKVDWDDARAQHGKIAYRSLSDGRWVVSVSGDGSVGLKKLSDDTAIELVAKPEVAEFSPVEQAQADAAKVGVSDVVSHLLGGN
ncbi:MAG: hypothetical protein AAGE65_00835 [Planctomycetota bacterium]